MPDLTTFGETMLRLSAPPAERLETATTLDCRTAGAESNVAIAAANLGVEAAWLSKLPTNALGRRVVRDLRANGVEPAIAWDGDPTSRLGAYYIDLRAEPRGPSVIYDRDRSAVTTAEPDDFDLDLISESTYFCTSGITPGLSSTLYQTTVDLLEHAVSADVATVLDVNYRAGVWSRREANEAITELLPLVDVVVSTERDARTVLGYDGAVDAIARSLRSQYDADLVVITCGGDGVLATDGASVYRQPAFPVETLDPIGSGDAFLGGFLARRLAGDEVPTALEFGAATAALARTLKGDWAVLTEREINRVRDGETGISR